MMGAACARHSKVTQIKVNAKQEIESNSEADELFMNFSRPITYHTATAHTTLVDKTDTDISSVSSWELEPSATNVDNRKDKNAVNPSILETPFLSDKRETKDLSITAKVNRDTVVRDTATKETVANSIKGQVVSKEKNNVDVTRKVGEILDRLIPPDSPTHSSTVGRQSRLMYADLNTVVFYDLPGAEDSLRKQVPKQKKKKGKPTTITVRPFSGDEETMSTFSRENSPEFHVCKHGIPLVEDWDDEGAVGCVKCQRPVSRGGRELQGLLKLKRIERKTRRKAWAKGGERLETLLNRNNSIYEK